MCLAWGFCRLAMLFYCRFYRLPVVKLSKMPADGEQWVAAAEAVGDDLERSADLRSVLVEYPDVLVIEDDHAAAVSGSPLHSIGADRERWATI